MRIAGAGKRNIIVIGSSAGGIGALIELVHQFPQNFEASVFIVQHVASFTISHLPEILTRAGKLPAHHAVDGETVQNGQIYVAPPDFHLLVDKGRVVVKKGPKENRFRPSIDALFRSAAYSYGARVISIVLSGMLDDGTSGMWTVKRMGGIAIIQDPNEAICPSMPHNVMEYVDVDHILPVNKMGAILRELVTNEVNIELQLPEEEWARLQVEVNIAAQNNSFDMGGISMGEPTALTCPECSGVLSMISDGNLKRYRCHTGHAYTQNALLTSATKHVEENIWKTIKSFEEVILLLEDSAQQLTALGNPSRAADYKKEAEITRTRSAELRKMVFQVDRLSGDTVREVS